VFPALRSFKDLTCTFDGNGGPDIGAVQSNGRLFELNMPGVYRYTE
jgi:hypothetical protein